jgi:hypothetical protein
LAIIVVIVLCAGVLGYLTLFGWPKAPPPVDCVGRLQAIQQNGERFPGELRLWEAACHR